MSQVIANDRLSQDLTSVLVARLKSLDEAAAVVRDALDGKPSLLPIERTSRGGDGAAIGEGRHLVELHLPGSDEPLMMWGRPLGAPIGGRARVRLSPFDHHEVRRAHEILGLDPDAADPMLGRTLGGRYAIEACIGRGGMGVVYRATHIKLDRPVAVKVLHADQQDAAAAARFVREARAVSRLDHPGILRVLDFAEDDGGVRYMVMELLEGHTLEEEAARGPLAVGRAVEIVARVADALGAAHEAGVVHRDIKPENVMLVRTPHEERVVVCDFGLAILASRALIAQTGAQTGAHPVLAGTPEYMAPEQCRGEEVGPAADVYACGVMLYRLIAGVVPFVRATSMATLVAHISEPPPPPSGRRQDLGGPVEAVMLAALAKDPAARPPNGAALASALRAIQPGSRTMRTQLDLPHPQRADRADPLEVLAGEEDGPKLAALDTLRLAGAIDRAAVARIAAILDPRSRAEDDLRVAAACALAYATPDAHERAVRVLCAAMLPRTRGVIGMLRGDVEDAPLAAAEALITLAGDLGREHVLARALRSSAALRVRLLAIADARRSA
ncbi:MAG: serine/threonine protein kinase [Deltaproteobacteria bacterium]|nr:serine/threonine protein kinase [Deltaproteobacteria bacterium]